tara:strand:+ start:191 stop:427 length:237 start_codon:yes stop_codon:yes gene_type:complete
MIGLRQYRTKVFIEQVEEEWKEKFKNFFKNNLDKPWNWYWLSRNIFSNAKKNFVKRYNEYLSAYPWGVLRKPVKNDNK